MAWYVEFEVENEKEELKFWELVENIGKNAAKLKEDFNMPTMIDLCDASIEFAKHMGYIDNTMWNPDSGK